MDIRGHYHTLQADGAIIDELALQADILPTDLKRALLDTDPFTLTDEQAERFLAITPETRRLHKNSRISRRDMDEAVIALLESGYRLSILERITKLNRQVILNDDPATKTVLNRNSAAVLDAAEEFAYRADHAFTDSRFADGVARPPAPDTLARAHDLFIQRWGVPFKKNAICTKLGIGVAR